MTVPTPPTPVDASPSAVRERLGGVRVPVSPEFVSRLAEGGVEMQTGDVVRMEAGRDWWPLAIGWAAQGSIPALPGVVARPTSVEQVALVLAECQTAGMPVTPIAGRSGVCGGSIPIFGGVALDCTGLVGEVVVDEESLLADIPAGIFGPDLEATLGKIGSGYTLGHWPQSMDLSTVGGWLACRGAGQMSTRYGKIEDMVVGLTVVLADGRIIHTDGTAPRSATGPSLTQLFVGSEGTLGVITSARMRIHPLPAASGRRSYGFATFAQGLEACRRILRRGATPAVLRLYDEAESKRNFDVDDHCILIVFDEADTTILDATLAVVDEECSSATPLSLDLVDRWLDHRNDVSALAPLWRAGIVVDTVEVAGRWSVLQELHHEVQEALTGTEGTLMASVHQSHAYLDGACLYFTFAGRRPEKGTADDLTWEEHYYQEAWATVTRAVIRHGAAISHHHGIGLHRTRFMKEALGGAFEVLVAVKTALDPHGILNPGKLGLPSALGEVPWP